MSSVSIILRKDKVNKKGEYPIHFRIIKYRKVNYISSGFSTLESNWDEKNKRIKARGSDSKETASRINAQISKRFSEIQQEVISLETSNRNVSIKTIKDKVIGKKSMDFFEFANSVTESYLTDSKIGTYSKTKGIIEKLKKYDSSLSFIDITPKFLTAYEAYLRTKLNNSTNTIHTNLKFIRTVFNKAFQQDIIELSSSPFLKFKMKTEKVQRDYLTEDELKIFAEVDTQGNLKLELHQDMFVFAAYSGGLRISDILQLQWIHFDDSHINFTIKKTGSQISIKIPNIALNIIEKYNLTQSEKTSYIFPMLPEDTYLRDAIGQDKAISSATAVINKNLKTLAKLAKIEKNISFHISRHTWATRALRKGMSIDKVSKLMGHSAIKETQIYAKIVNSELDKAMDIFND
ncbi:site-specific integrase [Fluviicola taffensis]|uniref:Integrase family protein n=1 Tax=Fluviicola taffensis (strain DSM 16823 / NCIMB 13979 / RW262) TaxID=755732 RepID=F2IEY5_FLUTR|nr:site-specific integrase [Fluviicola taffensis]AEA42450.1 integrase family protein [Fluviicola taffensis DSM 16823]